MAIVEEGRQCPVMVLHLKRNEREELREGKNGKNKSIVYVAINCSTPLLSSKSKKSDSKKKHRDHTSSAVLSFPTTSIQKLSKLIEVS